MTNHRCNVCNQALEPHFSEVKDPQSGELFAIERCSACGLGHTVPQPAELAAYYGEKYYGNRHSFTQRYCMRRRVRMLRRACPPGAHTKLLDVGCGDGSFLALAREQGYVVAGTELGDNAQPAKLGIEVRELVDDWSDRAPFDVVTMWHSLEHFRDVKGAARAVARVMRPDGVLVVAVPDFGGLQARAFGPNWFHLDVPRHLYHFDARALATLLEKAGFRIVGSTHHESELDLFGWMQSALNSVLPRPNVLFQKLTGKPAEASAAVLGASFVGGAVLAPLTIPATLTSVALRRGATQIVVARAV